MYFLFVTQIELGKASLLDSIFAGGDATVFLSTLGGAVPGKGTRAVYNGGAFGSDGRLYLIPRNAGRVARFDISTQTWESFGESFPLSGNKWIDAGVSNFDGCIYSIPGECNNVSRVLQIDPSKGQGTVRMVGDSVLGLADGVKEWPWFGTVAASDGCVYGIPRNAKSVLKFDPRQKTLSTFGKLGEGLDKYRCAVLGQSGRFIFCIPNLAARVLCIDTQTQTCELIGEDYDGSITEKWCAGAVGGDGAIYCVPRTTVDRVLRIDPWTKTTSLFGPALHASTGWFGAVAGTDGCVYGTPYSSSRVLRIDPFARTVSMVGGDISPDLAAKLRHAVKGPDDALWCLPYQLPSSILRVQTPGPERHTPLLTRLLEAENQGVLREGLADANYHGPALAAVLYHEATRAGVSE